MLDGYGLTRQLELLAREQIATGQQVRVLALTATRGAVATFEQLGIDCRVLNRRWQRDPFVAVQMVGELRSQVFDVAHAWDRSTLRYLATLEQLPGLAPAATLAQTKVGAAPGVVLPQQAQLTRQEFLAEQWLPADSILIAVAGPLIREQQVDEAIWYFELVRTLEERVRLLIFGDGPDLPRLERFARLTSEPAAIRLLGYRSDFRQLLPYTNLFWHTAAEQKSPARLPLTVLEAMAAGLPIIAHEGPTLRQIITDGQDGLLVADKDRAAFARQTLRLVEDTQLAQALGGKAIETITKRFSLPAMMQATTQLYAKLLLNKTSHAHPT